MRRLRHRTTQIQDIPAANGKSKTSYRFWCVLDLPCMWQISRNQRQQMKQHLWKIKKKTDKEAERHQICTDSVQFTKQRTSCVFFTVFSSKAFSPSDNLGNMKLNCHYVWCILFHRQNYCHSHHTKNNVGTALCLWVISTEFTRETCLQANRCLFQASCFIFYFLLYFRYVIYSHIARSSRHTETWFQLNYNFVQVKEKINSDI